MKTRAWIVAIVVVVVALVGTIVLVRAAATAPLGRVAGRVCVGCVETHWNGTSRIGANRITGRYAFREDAPYRVAFSAGSVVLAGEALDPGCHGGRAAEGHEIRFDDAREVRVEVPPGPDGCPDGGGSRADPRELGTSATPTRTALFAGRAGPNVFRTRVARPGQPFLAASRAARAAARSSS